MVLQLFHIAPDCDHYHHGHRDFHAYQLVVLLLCQPNSWLSSLLIKSFCKLPGCANTRAFFIKIPLFYGLCHFQGLFLQITKS